MDSSEVSSTTKWNCERQEYKNYVGKGTNSSGGGQEIFICISLEMTTVPSALGSSKRCLMNKGDSE